MRLLCVDDEPEICRLVQYVAEERGYEVEIASNTARLGEIYRRFSPDVIVLDLTMPESDGIEGLVALGAAKCDASLILISGFAGYLLSSAAKLAKLYDLRVIGALPKPFDRKILRDLLAEEQLPQHRGRTLGASG